MSEFKKMAIVGYTKTKELAPFNDPEFEIWGMNDLYKHIARWTRWFDIHGDDVVQASEQAGAKPGRDTRAAREARFKTMNCPIYMTEKHPDIPNSTSYPLDEILEHFGQCFTKPEQARYFTNTVSYMLALGIYEGFEEIHVYGIDMATNCVAPETRILTSDLRWVRADEINIGDKLIGFDEEASIQEWSNKKVPSRRWEESIVTNNKPLIKPCYKITMEDGTEMITSDLHKWLTYGENRCKWKTTDKLVTSYHRKGRPTRILKMVEPWDQPDTWDAGYLAAAFDGEGHYSNCKQQAMPWLYYSNIGFSQKDNEMLGTVTRLLQKYSFDYTNNGNDVTNKLSVNGGKAEIMRFLGQMRPPRLIAHFDPNKLGAFWCYNKVGVKDIEFIGEHPVIGLGTTTKTFIAEGFASHNSEYGHQKPSCEFWLGVAAGRGIKIYVPDEADLLKARFLYGYEAKQQRAFEKKCAQVLKDLETKKNQAIAQKNQWGINEAQYTGAIQGIKELFNNYQ